MLLKSGAALVLLGLVAFVLIYTSGGEKDATAASSFVAEVDPLNPGTVVFRWEGPIDPPMARQFSDAFNTHKNEIQIVRIELNSPGGGVDEGNRVVNLIGKMKKTHRVQTYVGEAQECLSMCVPIYLQGNLRIASASSTWLFHSVSATDPFTGAEVVLYAHERNQANFDFINRYIDRSEIDPEWRERLKTALRVGDVWKTGQELKDERSNIVMMLED